MNRTSTILFSLLLVLVLCLSGCASEAPLPSGSDGAISGDSSAGESVSESAPDAMVSMMDTTGMDLEVPEEDQQVISPTQTENTIDLNRVPTTQLPTSKPADPASSASGAETTPSQPSAVELLHITSGGSYSLSGVKQDVMVTVDAGKEDVILVLNGVTLENRNGPALYVKSAGKVTLTLAEGTENRMSDGNAYTIEDSGSLLDAAVFSRSDLTLNGTGALTVQGNYKHGIESKDDLVITSGTVQVTARNVALSGKDCVKISGGNLTLQAGSDGVRSNNAEETDKGYITVENTTLNITAGNDGIQAENLLRLTGVSLSVQSGGGSGNAPDEINSYKGIKAGSDVLVTGGSIQIDARDDAIHSDGTVSLSGGKHTLSSGGDGIQAETDLSVSDSEVTVKAAAKGMNANQLVVQKASLHITAAGNGLDAKGDITLSEARALIFGATKTDSTSLDFGRSVRITGGFVLGLSGSGADPALNSVGQGVVYSSVGDQGEGTTVSVTDGSGNLLCSEKAPSAYNVVVFSGAGLQAGQSATLTAGSYTASVNVR